MSIMSDFLYPEFWNYVLVVLTKYLLLWRSLYAAHYSAVHHDLFPTYRLRFFSLYRYKYTLASLESILGKYSRYGSPVENLTILGLS